MPNMDYYNELIAGRHAAKEEESSSEAAIRKAQANLFFDENSMIEMLAEQRFPGDPAAALRYTMRDGELVYEDDDGNLVPEFSSLEDAGMYDKYFVPNIVPATTLAADMGGGMAGASMGFQKGLDIARMTGIKHPLAVGALTLGGASLGGMFGNLAVGGTQRAGRELLLDQYYNLPPEEVKAAWDDLLISSAFSSIPFGAGPTRNIMQKFTGKEDSLRYLMNLRKDVQGTIDEAAELGIDLTPAEAADFATKAVNIQHFLSMQPQIRAVRDFYSSRAQRIREGIEIFADKVGSGNFGRLANANEQVQAAAHLAIKEINQKRRDRAGVLYDSLREESIHVDTAPLIASLDEIILNKNRPKTLKEAAEAFKASLVNPVNAPPQKISRIGDDGQEIIETVEQFEPITDLMSLHDLRTTDIEKIIGASEGTANINTIIGLREDLTRLLDAADESGTYALARRVYDPEKVAALQIERSAIGRLSNLITNKQTARAVKEIFDPNVSVRGLRNARRVLKTVDPDGWQDAKKFFITSKLDDLTKQTNEVGLPAFQDYFAKPNMRNMLKELFEPDEFDNFYKMMDLVGKALRTVPRGGSSTQSQLTMENILASEAGVGSVLTAGKKLALVSSRLGPRIVLGQAGDEALKSIALKQTEAYYTVLADVLFSDDAAKSIDEAYHYFNQLGYLLKQGGARGAVELIPEGDRPYQPTEEDRDRIMKQIEEAQSSISPQFDVPVFDPVQDINSGPQPNLYASPSILPAEEDREIAERLAMARSGIGGLMT